jgi:uncharacterized Zn finger protein
MQIQEGGIRALVSGSSLYEVKIRIKKLRQKNWTDLKTRCAGEIGSLLELLEGRLSDNVMEIVTDRDRGLFPRPGEIALSCSCPDWAMMCKHVAAVLYGVGARLDERPESLFLLRGVNHEELVTAGVGHIGKRAAGDRAEHRGRGKSGKRGKPERPAKRLASERISEVFGIDMEMGDEPAAATAGRRSRAKAAAKSRAKAPAARRGKVPTARRGKAPAARRGKAPAARRGKAPAARRGAASRVRRKSRTPTGRGVAALRRKFGMTQHEFASLLGVGASAVSVWEKKRGTLRMRKDSLDAWRSVEGLTPRGARRRLGRVGL